MTAWANVPLSPLRTAMTELRFAAEAIAAMDHEQQEDPEVRRLIHHLCRATEALNTLTDAALDGFKAEQSMRRPR
jgi:hypothetical protein